VISSNAMYGDVSRNTFERVSSALQELYMVTSRREDPVQVVPDGPQVASWTHAGVHLGLSDISCRCTCSICTACFVVWRPRRAADTSTNRRQDFLCRRTASMEHAADTAEAAAVDHYVSSSTENIFVPVCKRTPGNRLMIVL